MKLLAAIVKKEVLQHFQSFRFVAVACIMLALTALAGFVGTDDYLQRVGAFEQQVELSQQELASINVYSYLQPVIAREPEPLSVFDRGFEDRLGNEVRIHLYALPTLASSNASSQDLGAGSRELDLTMIVRLVLGLLALLLTFDTVVGERENGLLKQILANDLGRVTVVAGKFLGGLLALALPLLAGFSMTLWLLLERAGGSLADLQWLRLAGLLAAYGAYLSAMLLVGLVLSLLARSTSAALGFSLFAWLAIVFLIPQAATSVATVLGDDRPAVESEVRELEKARDRELAQLKKQRRFDLLNTSTVHSAPLREGGATGMVGAELWRYGSSRFYDVFAEFQRQKAGIVRDSARRIFEARQRHQDYLAATAQTAHWLSSPSPAFLLERLAEAFAGTSVDDHDRFLKDARFYRRTVIEYLESRDAFGDWRWFTDDVPPRPWVTEILGLSLGEAENESFDSVLERFLEVSSQKRYQELIDADGGDVGRRLNLDDLPAFEPPRSELAPVVRRIAPEMFSLLLILGILSGAVTLGFLRYDVSATSPSRRAPDRADIETKKRVAPASAVAGSALR